jgi:hypothetical protein
MHAIAAAALAGSTLDGDLTVMLARTVDRVVKLALPHSEVFEVGQCLGLVEVCVARVCSL